jgi:hypothetical protein
MFKIEIQADDGCELKMSKHSFFLYKCADGKDSYWEWEYIAGKAQAFDFLSTQAKFLIDKAEAHVPDLPMTGLR